MINRPNLRRLRLFCTAFTLLLLAGSAPASWGQPTVQASGIVISPVSGSTTSMRFDWGNGNGSNRVVIVSQSGSTFEPVDGSSYAANSNYGSGSNLDGGGNLAYCVFDGSGSTVTVTNLVPGTEYIVHVYEYTTSPTKYSTLEASGNPITYTGYTADNTYSPPSGIKSLHVQLWGAGGGGGGGSNGGGTSVGSGGGGGGYSSSYMTVTSLTVQNITIGAQGLGGAGGGGAGGPGSAGSATTFTSDQSVTLTAAGGAGGLTSGTVTAAGVGTTFNGGTGGAGVQGGGSGGGGGGSSAGVSSAGNPGGVNGGASGGFGGLAPLGGGDGGMGGASGAAPAPFNGLFPGGGGGGGGNGGGVPGGNGANGLAILSYSQPTVSSITSSNVDGTFGGSSVISIQVTFSETVFVSGSPYLTLETGTTDRNATYVTGDGTATLTFNYTVQSGDVSADLDYVSSTALNMNGGSIADPLGNMAILALPVPGSPYSLGSNKDIIIDTTPPAVVSVSSTTTNGTRGIGFIVSIQVTFDENIFVSGTPTLLLETGAVDESATFTNVGGNVMNFDYTIQSGDISSDLQYVGVSSLTLNAGAVHDGALNNAILVLPALASANSLGSYSDIVIDGIAPTVTINRSASQTDPTTALPVSFDVIFSEPVNTGTFVAGDFLVGGSATAVTSLANPLGDFKTWIALVTGTAGTISIDLGAGAVSDLAGNTNTTSTSTDNTVTYVGASSSSDIVANAGFSPPTDIPYENYQESSLTSTSLEVAQFNIQDGGGAIGDADGNSTILTDIQLTISNSADLQRVALFDGATKLAEKPASGTVTFSGLTLTALDDGSKTFSIRVSYNATVTDNDQNVYTITSVTADATGSLFAAADGGGASSSISDNYIEVTATKLLFDSPLTTTPQSTDFSMRVTAYDDNNNADVDYIENVTISLSGGSGNISTLEGLTNAAQGGSFTWNTLQVDQAGASYTVSCSDAGGGLSLATASAPLAVTCLSPTVSLGGVINNTACTLGNGSATVTATTPSGEPSSYTMTWFDQALNQISTNTNVTNGAIGFTATGLVAGTYVASAKNNDTGCSTTSPGSIVIIDNQTIPDISPGAFPTVNQGVTTGNLTYSSPIGAPDKYTIDFDLTAEGQGFADVTATALPASPIVITVPAGALPATYNATITVLNTSTACVGAPSGFTVTVMDATPPTVTSVSSSTINGTYGVGSLVAISVTFSEVVTVTGTPQVTLETGAVDRVVNYGSGTGTNTLLFTYAVQAGDVSADLDYTGSTALALNGGTIQDGALNNATLTLAAPGAANSLGANKAITIDGVVPTVTTVSSTTADGNYAPGATIAVTVQFSEVVTVTGTPQITLETGTTDRVINYAGGSGSATLVFNYTVQTGDASADLDYVSTSSLALNGGLIKDGAMNNATLTLAAPGVVNSLGANKAIVVDGVVPSVASVSSGTANGTYGIGAIVAVTVTFTETVTVTGTPQLTLETGATDRVVNYASGSGSTTLVFNYTVQSGDVTADLDYVSTSSLALNSGTVKDVAGNNATLTLASPAAANSLGANKAIVIDTTAPTVTSVTSTTANGSYGVGGVIAVTVIFSEAVTVTGTPRITLETGTTDRTADYTSGSGTNTLVFNYTVQSGDVSADLDYVSALALALNGGTVKDGATNNATLTLAAPGAANSLGANKAIVIDATAPTVTSVSSTTANGTYGVGAVLAITVTFSEAVTVTGTPQITMETGAIDRVVNFTSGSTSAILVFNYTVQAGDGSADLDYTSISALALNGGTIKDAAGNNATLTLATPGVANSLGANKAIVIDGVLPLVTSVSSTTVNATYGAGAVIAVTVTFSKTVTVTGTPQITLETGTNDRVVNYTNGSGSTILIFNYTVQSGDASPDLDYVSTSALALNGGTIKDAAGNNATLTLSSPGAANSLGANRSIVIDATPPTVTSVSSSTANGSFGAGSIVAVTVTFSESVVVSGTPQITLETGTTDRNVNYASGTGSTTLVFNYTVQPGDVSPDLDYVATTSLALNGGTIKDAAGNGATLTLPAPAAANSLGANKAIVIDGASPTVTSVSSTTADGSYGVGSAVAVTVTFSEIVTVTGTPQITLETGATDRAVAYTSGTGTTTLVFNYTVQLGDASSDLDYVNTTSLILNSGTIKDATGNSATLTLPAPGATNSLAASKAIVIDGAPPTVTSVSSTTVDGLYGIGSSIAITVTFSKSVIVTGTPQITIETGTTDQVANYASGSATATLVFNYIVQSGSVSADLDYVNTTSLALNGGTIKDATGNTASLTLATPGAVNSLGANKALVIDGVAPLFSATAPVSNSNILDTRVSFTLSENLTSGSITWTRTGGTADPNVHDITLTGAELAAGAHSNITLTNNPTLVNRAIYSVSFAGTDAAGNTATVVTNTNITYEPDPTPPVVFSISYKTPATSPTNATSLTFQVAFQEDVVGVDGADFTPTLSGVTAGNISVSALGANIYDVTIANVSGNGTVRLDVLSSATIKDLFDNAYVGNYTSGPVYTVDTVVPVILANGPASNSTVINTEISYNLSEPLTSGTITWTSTGGVTDPIVHQQTLAGPELTVGDHNNITLTNSPALVVGSVYTISFAGVDGAGNAAAVASLTDVTYAPDVTPPTVLSVVRQTPVDSLTNAKTLTFRVTFSESVTHVDASDFTKTLSSVFGGEISVTQIDDVTYDVQFAVSGTGAVKLDVLAAATIVDAVENDYSVDFVGGQAYAVDQTPPVFSSISPAPTTTVTGTEVGYALSEQLATGSITWTWIGGPADPNVHKQELAAAEMTKGPHPLALLINSPTLVPGSIYSMSFDGVDLAGNVAKTVVVTNITYKPSANALSDIVVESLFNYPQNIDYISFQESADIQNTATSIVVAKFVIRDGGSSTQDVDPFPTILTSLKLDLGENFSLINRIALYDGPGETEVTGSERVVTGQAVTFSNIAIECPDGAELSFAVRVSFVAKVIDNTAFSLTVTAATTEPGKSGLASADGGGATTSRDGANNQIEVSASALKFIQQPSNTFIDTEMNPAVSVEAVDANENRDLDFAADVSLTSSGSMKGQPTASVADGVGIYSLVIHSAGGKDLTLTASGPLGLEGVSAPFDIYDENDPIVLNIHALITPTADDAQNNVLYIENIEFFPENTVKLLDRWGVPVKSWNNFSNYNSSDPEQVDFDFSRLIVGNYICVVLYKENSDGDKKSQTQMITVLK